MELFFLAVIGVLVMMPFWMISSKVGYPNWYSLFMLIPFVNIILLYVFAFSEWPIQRQLQETQDQLNSLR